MIIEIHDQYIIEATDFEDAFNKAYNNHTGYSDLIAIIRILEE